MKNQKPDVAAYLNRIGYDGPLDGSAKALAKIQEGHLHSIPYENFDIMAGIPLSLEVTDLLDKIVYRGRGGYCFELNALYKWLLEELGYPTISFFARFWRDEPNAPPKRRHHVLKVEAQGEYYLCDVGVGGIVPRWPIKMVEGLIHRQGDESYRLELDDYYGWVLCELKDGKWEWLYSFTEEPQLPKDYIMASFWCEKSPDSIFIEDAMVAVRTKEGRNTIAGKEFRIFIGDEVHTFVPKTVEEFTDALIEYFGLDISHISHRIWDVNFER
ncbi:MAG TPA: arylamine N-acetyltransferase [Clostridia bacterium]|nr:arylamine N-acetyltransferase [Clostridia bacterium]